MKKLLLLGGCGLMLCISAQAWAWGPGAHRAIANRIMEDSYISNEIDLLGYSKSNIASEAAWGDVNMPSSVHHGAGQYYNLKTEAALNASWMTWPINETYAGWILHNIADVCVPSCHSPAGEIYCASWAENEFEAQGEAYSTPGWPSPAYYIANWWDYDIYTEYHHQEILGLAQHFKNHNKSHWSCKYFHVCQTDWIDPDCRRAAFKLGWNTFWWYLAYHS